MMTTATTTTHDPAAPVAPEIAARVAQIMTRPYRKVITGDAEEGFLIEVPDLPGCMTGGETIEEAVELLHDAMALWLIVALEQGDAIPEPSVTATYSGRVLVRMPKSLHRRLIERSEEEGVSANQLAVATLAEGLGVRAAARGASADATPAEAAPAERVAVEAGTVAADRTE